MISVVIADDQQLVVDGFRLILDVEPDIQVIGHADGGRRAVDEVLRLNPDVVLMDIRMPDVDGIQATRALIDAGSASRILILTTFDSESYLYEAMRAGASGFLVKDVRRDQLTDAIRAIAGGESLVAPRLVRQLVEDFCHRPPPSSGTPVELQILTERELDVLKLVARGRSNAEIAGDLFLSEATVKTHLAHLTQKLGLRDRVQAVVLAYESGLVRPGDF
jgi:DNA-binding NarL/FixJ family response regulator